MNYDPRNGGVRRIKNSDSASIGLTRWTSKISDAEFTPSFWTIKKRKQILEMVHFPGSDLSAVQIQNLICGWLWDFFPILGATLLRQTYNWKWGRDKLIIMRFNSESPFLINILDLFFSTNRSIKFWHSSCKAVQHKTRSTTLETHWPLKKINAIGWVRSRAVHSSQHSTSELDGRWRTGSAW